jgi:DEAD/DEAH box helicase domain-containing protein
LALGTQRCFGDVGGAKNKDKMGVSIGVVYASSTEQYHIFGEDQLDELIKMLLTADLVVGYNHINFDYPVLNGYTILDFVDVTLNLDMLVSVESELGHRVKLDSIASASLGAGKTGDGLDALRWWKEYDKTGDSELMIKIAQYVCYKVKTIKEVHEYGLNYGYVIFIDRQGDEVKCPVSWA